MNETRHPPDANQDPSDPFAFDYEAYAQLLDKDNQPSDPRVINKAWVTLIKTTEIFRENLREIFSVLNDSIGSQIFDTSSQGNRANFFESIEERLRYSSTLKAITSLNCAFVNYYEEALSTKSHEESFADGRSRKKQRTNNDIPLKEYERHRERIMKNLLQLIVVPLNKIADSQTEAKDIVSNVMRIAYKMIENATVNSLKSNKDLYDIVLSIIGYGIEKYNQSLGFCLKLIQILQYKEQLAGLMAEVVEFIVTRHNQRLLINEVMREIDRIDIKELSKDSSCPKAVSTFLITLSERCPQEFLPSLNHIYGFLEQDSYIMRNASLSVMANLHIKYLKDSENDKTLRDEILDTMLAHIRDSTGYTRSRALATWSLICENECFPLTHVVPVTKAAVNRLSDKSCFVRRSAAKFLVHILCRNPYYSKLPIKVFMERYHQEKAVFEKLLAEEKEKVARDEEVAETLSQHSADQSITSETDPETVHPNVSIRTLVQPEESPVEAQRRTLAFYQAALEFIKEIHRSIPLMIELLTSKNTTDIQEAIDFFVICHERGIDKALLGFKRMILLVNVTEKTIKDTILSAYRKIFFNPDYKDARIVANLLNFIETATIAESLSLEILVGQFVAQKDFTKSMERELFATFSKKKPNTTNEESIAAIQLIGMLAVTQPEIIHHNLPVCVQYGLTITNFDEHECRLARETCIAIKKSLPKKIEDRQKRPLRLAKDDELFVKLENILVEGLLNMNFEHWFSFCDESLKIIFEMAESADKICESIHTRLSDELLKNSIQCSTPQLQTQENTNRNESPDFVFQPSATVTTNGTTSSSQTQSANMEMVHPVALARFIHFLGDASLNLAVFLELHVLLEIKIRNALSSADANKDVSGQNVTVNNISISSRRRSRRFGGNKSVDDQNLEEEIGLAGAEAEDVEMEFIGGICDDEIVCGNNLLGKASRIIIEVVTDPNRYPQRELKLASALALAKFMMVSVNFCNNYLRLLFTILERTTDSEVKINLLVAISDLCVRFPNQLDGWTNKIFECLKSEDTLVRRSALKIISRLVLCDVMKAKEQISAIANLIVDDDEQIALYSRHFFLELSKKLNAIYNVLPDIISRLSSGANEANFRIVMKFIFELIDKSHHVERLIDKLCTRFQETDNERHWADLAYCLSLLKHSDRTMCKLIDKYDCYKDKLCIDSVRESIMLAVTTYRKNPGIKNEMKQMLDEFEKKLESSSAVLSEDEEEVN